MTQVIDKSTLSYSLSRVDKSIADNLMDIDKSFGKDAQNVLDFIIFISKRLNNNLFGFTRFTIKEYSEFTGIRAENLCAIHPDVQKGISGDITYSEHRFESVLEYTLLKMLKNNILFSKVVAYKDDGNIINLENFPILKDINVQGGNVLGTKKVYEVRLSDVMMNGFVQRYYTLDTSRLPLIGKGKGGHNKKKIFIWLNKIFHIYTTKGANEKIPLYSVDYLADIAGVRYKKELGADKKPVEKEPKHKKEAVSNILKSIHQHVNADKTKLHFSFDYKFTSDIQNSYQEDYFVEFDFKSNMHPEIVAQTKIAHSLKFGLLKELRASFDHHYPTDYLNGKPELESEKDSFQRWLNNNKKDLDLKVLILQTVYARAHHHRPEAVLSVKEATAMIFNGFLSLDPITIPPVEKTQKAL